MSPPTRAASGLPSQYLTFSLAGETFAIGILSIKEIIQFRGLTEVPMMPRAVRGVINLRGAVVPVVDLALRFGKPASTAGRRSCIVIVEIADGGDSPVLGVMVDAVSEVIEIPPDEIEEAPSFGASIKREFIAGIGKVRGRFVVLLEVSRTLSLDELAGLARPSPEGLLDAA
ncbi:chemotaxis protein CheW [Roseateles sp.]|uniref:chemotaxis protein CheW n=1 Tax=Roseateles sp. TaxID=1971397 RepID=UPI0025F16490|nr:chemotaxis protein CheW [Roseateles sp.]MBV8035883.1 purine-binding chemotaxis protein CheW [Roseateles sp.]